MIIDSINVTGKKVESITLPKEVFGVKVKTEVITQALRVYLSNQHQGSKKTLTRGEVDRTTAKVWKQKGTGRARHGSRKAPIFVGGGIVFGPNPENSPKLQLNKKQGQIALLGSLTIQAENKNLIVLDSVKEFDQKTKNAAKIFATIAGYKHQDSDKVLFVLPNPDKNIMLSCRNLPGITVTQAKRINIFEILNSKKIIFVKDSLPIIKDTFAQRKTTKKEN